MSKSRNFCFTINNPITDSPEHPKNWDITNIKFLIYQLEKGGNSATLHLQGYVMFKNPRSLSGVKKINGRAHWEVAKGTPLENYDYCSKSDTRVEPPYIYGEPPKGSGNRTDLTQVKEMIEAGAKEKDIAQQHFNVWVKYYRAFERYKRLQLPQRNVATQTLVLWGPPGSGKSATCQAMFPDAFWLAKPANGQGTWFDGYDNHESVIIDEFYGWLPYDFMCRLLDRYPFVIQTKGGAVQFVAKYVIITSNQSPDCWYNDGLRALERRLTPPLGKIEFVPYSEKFPDPAMIRPNNDVVCELGETYKEYVASDRELASETVVPEVPTASECIPSLICDEVLPPQEEVLSQVESGMDWVVGNWLA